MQVGERTGARHANIGVSGECERLGELSLDERLVMRLGPLRIKFPIVLWRFQYMRIFTFDQGAASR
jgi:hypothetical protein